MKKTGFTLSELLITLTVIGVVSALALPAVSGIIPDKNKAKILKYNAELNNIVSSILTDDSVYRPYTGYDKITGDTFLTIDGVNSCIGLDCVSGGFKSVLEERYTTKKTDQDGSVWEVNSATEQGAYILKVVTDGKTSKQVAFNKTGKNKNINTFYFYIDKYGNVEPGDALTKVFLDNYKNLNDRKADIAAAKASNYTVFK